MIDPPRRFVIETTAVCNLGCVYCPTGQGLIDREPYMPWGLFEKVTDQIEPFAKHVYIEFMGEPALHPLLPQMIDRVNRFATIDLATNGTRVDSGLAKEIAKCSTTSVTISGLGDVYRQVHGADEFERALAGMRYLIEAKPKKLSWTWIVLNINEHQLPEARKLAEELGVAIRPKSGGLGLSSRELKPSPRYSRYTEDNALLFDRFRCTEFWDVGYVCSDGTVTSCGFDWAPLRPMGNIYGQDFLDIWNGEQYRQLRRNHRAGRLAPACRLLCGAA